MRRERRDSWTIAQNGCSYFQLTKVTAEDGKVRFELLGSGANHGTDFLRQMNQAIDEALLHEENL